ncbi:hypothetical protein EST38_g4896 [Candolleomyces aberdarensis]|uniref:Uncharacterized protein n=1 Tax=Candolleomyces aberdarensis TaxID=2316362 RepID=A0A4Q2DP75_9AGAR|nr:hypothetical protein EST38_g4896 [Candolleomyces aberdarensis]
MSTPPGARAILAEVDGWSPSLGHEEEEILGMNASPVARDTLDEPPTKRVKITDGLSAMPPRFKAKKLDTFIELHTYAKFEEERAHAILNFIGRADGSDVVEGFFGAGSREKSKSGAGSVQVIEKVKEVGNVKEVGTPEEIGIVREVEEVVEQRGAVRETKRVENVDHLPVSTVRFILESPPEEESRLKNARRNDIKKGGTSKGKAANAKVKQRPNAERLQSLRARIHAEGLTESANKPTAEPVKDPETKKIESGFGGVHLERPIIKLRKSARAPKPSNKAAEAFSQTVTARKAQGSASASAPPTTTGWRRVAAAPEL